MGGGVGVGPDHERAGEGHALLRGDDVEHAAAVVTGAEHRDVELLAGGFEPLERGEQLPARHGELAGVGVDLVDVATPGDVRGQLLVGAGHEARGATAAEVDAAGGEPPEDAELAVVDVDAVDRHAPVDAVRAPDLLHDRARGHRRRGYRWASAPPRRWPWVAGSLAALIALVLQAALVFRVELAVLQPESRPALEFLCEFAGCEVGLPAKVGLVGIEASDLHPDSEHQGRLALAATLKNRAPFAQQFPHLELALTDTVDQAIARKVLAPADYLPATADISGGMKPNADTMIALGIDPGSMAASGYRLYLFYP